MVFPSTIQGDCVVRGGDSRFVGVCPRAGRPARPFFRFVERARRSGSRPSAELSLNAAAERWGPRHSTSVVGWRGRSHRALPLSLTGVSDSVNSMGSSLIRCRRLAACAVVFAQLFATGFVLPHCHGDEHGPAEWHRDGHEHSHGCHDDHRPAMHDGADHARAAHHRHRAHHAHHGHSHAGSELRSSTAVHGHACRAARSEAAASDSHQHQHDGHQHPPGSGGCFEGDAGAAAAGRGGSAESTAPLELSRDVVAMADGLACPPREAGLQRRVAREAADAVGSVRDLRPHVLRI